MDLLGAGVGGEVRRVAVGVADGLPEAGGWGGFTLGPPTVSIEQAADEQRLVAQHLGVEPEPRAARQQPVGRVLRQRSPA